MEMQLYILIWVTGAIAAWFQIHYWNRNNIISYPKDYIIIGLASILFSWGVYLIYVLEWLCNKFNKE